eukprot:COSAG01_NODE_62301_length_285_cov_0.876344_1_plen_33_part_10
MACIPSSCQMRTGAILLLQHKKGPMGSRTVGFE